MIQANELRLGNLVKIQGDPSDFYGTICSIHTGSVRILYEGDKDGVPYGIDIVEGIPLTAEWLERFGFDKLFATSQPPSEPSGAKDLAEKWTTKMFKALAEHGMGKEVAPLLASDITALVDAEKEKHAAGFAEWAARYYEYWFADDGKNWKNKSTGKFHTTSDLLHIYNTKNQ